MYPGHSYLIDSHAWNYICDSKYSAEEIKNSTYIGNYVNTPESKYEKLDTLYAVHNLTYTPWAWNNYAEGTKSGDGSKYHKGTIPKDVMKQRTGTGTSTLVELATGASDDFKVYNIYDMAGNMWEWTTETGTNSKNTTAAVHRGGCFDDNSGIPVVDASGHNATYVASVQIGFRVVLYL